MKNEIRDYFSDWEGWSCSVVTLEDGTVVTEDDDKYDDGDTCLEVIENTRKELQRHLKEVHKIDVELK